MKSDGLSGIKILYVEDETAIREGMLRFLKRRSSNVQVAANGAIGLELFKSFQPDIVVTDIRMPVMDGLEMSRKIKEESPSTPIIITTGHNDEEFFLKSIDIGIDKYIKKPVKFNEVTEVILSLSANVLHRKEMEKQVRFLEDVMDLNPNYLMTTDGVKCSYINKSLLDYLGCTDKKDFWEKYGTIDSVLVNSDGMFYSGKKVYEWVSAFKKGENETKTVIMRPFAIEGAVESTFLLSVKEVPSKDEWLLSFTDVTHIDNERKVYRTMSQQDPLTGIFNRKMFFDELEREVERCSRYGQNLSLIMLDVDFFKEVNDNYGHQAGDRVLIEITNIINSAIRKTDVFARYGGEEFVILMPGTNLSGARDIAERLKDTIADYYFEDCGRITCSFGIGEYLETDNIDSFVHKADIALYLAKEAGRNSVKVFEKGSFECTE
jgi:diguanylate cyclase (GGDEF)-like protein